ncbi:MAG: bifunctional N(6)-L-threonylcarbamoyladenine synthase/serine/threonine protein kinase [Methanoregulaceae archaeon]|jgi:N6-L-threonylcarbamoyladenine synthase/protein kinase Bud32|nr:bifunctional N(6)-L-threonylcarbamoyladenine synthase/serine/threonine protein kinase [Methanoregulaceae archaeon]
MPVFGPVLGIEGTAWNLSAAVFDTSLRAICSRPYKPAQGGIHPREAAQHHASEMKDVISRVLLDYGDTGAIEGVAFSIGPGLGPCLRTVATASRSLSLALGVPLVGVNHCVAHVEIGRYATGCDDPVTLYASGANTQVIGYLKSRYRIFGETLDIGLGNALDKFARSKGLPHPGGPVIEELAGKGSYIELPYTVKGMDLAFSGLVSAAKECRGTIEDVCNSLQETAFAMCVEVTERALAHSGKDEVLLVGGVGANRRLRDMLKMMAEERGASFHVPDTGFMGDNGAMIAYTGRVMLEHGVSTPIAASHVNPSFRVDQVEVVWRSDETTSSIPVYGTGRTTAIGAEAVVTIGRHEVCKERRGKCYRSPGLDRQLIRERTRMEARLISMARRAGVPTPVISDITEDSIRMEKIEGPMLKECLGPDLVCEAGGIIGRLHQAGIIHGDLTTSNILVRDGRCVLIDFGLAQVSSEVEPRGVDIHVFFQTLESMVEDHAVLRQSFIEGYSGEFDQAAEVVAREQEILHRGRYL